MTEKVTPIEPEKIRAGDFIQWTGYDREGNWIDSMRYTAHCDIATVNADGGTYWKITPQENTTMPKRYIDLANQVFAETNAAYLADVREVLRWLDRNPDQVPGRTITLDTLSAAWDAAEVGTPRKGDVVIEGYPGADDLDGERPDGTAFDVYQVTEDFDPVPAARCLRILSRAPEPTNTEKLEGVLGEGSPVYLVPQDRKAMARYLTDHGWVKAPETGDDDEQ